MSDQAIAWANWAVGVLDGINAPVSGINVASLWNWANMESGANVMRWNNPLNTTMPWAGAINENSVGVKMYPSVFDGIQATVATLLNGRYPTIVANLRGQVPHQRWQNAAGELGTWGTGASWLGWNLQPPTLPGSASSPSQEDEMTCILDAGTPAKWLLSGGMVFDIPDPATLKGYQDAGVKTIPVSQAFVDRAIARCSGGGLSGKLTGSLGISGTLQAA